MKSLRKFNLHRLGNGFWQDGKYVGIIVGIKVHHSGVLAVVAPPDNTKRRIYRVADTISEVA